MSFSRRHLFEFNDAGWAPPVLRDTMVEALSRTLEWAHVLRGLVTPFESFLAASGAREVLDLASGAAGPARILATEILRAGRTPPRSVLTDLYPRIEAWEAARAELPGVLDFELEPVDATRIPERLATDRVRVIINAFHHLPPDMARGVLEDAVLRRSPIFLAEAFERDPRGFIPIALPGLFAMLATPLLTPRDRLAKALLVWSSPLVFAIGAWDGVVSTLRTYSRGDLETMVAPLGDGFVWTYGNYTFPLGGEGYYFHGVPRRTSGDRA
jgi:hypothetical protein